MPTLTVCLAGITGKFGRLLASKLPLNPNMSLRGYARGPSKVVETISDSSRVTLFKGEASDPVAIKPFVNGCDIVVCAYLGSDDLMIDGQKHLIDACEEEGVPRPERLGSLDDLKAKMHQLQADNPADVFSYMPLFFTYYWLNGQKFIGPETDNEQYSDVKPETWEDFLQKRSLEELPHAYFSLAN
ncbi:hypothetical protein ACJ41O_012207 [Fusarium nematophilum]